MNFAAEVLVIILSVTLIVFLIFAIILIGYVIGLTRQIRRMTDTAEKTVVHIEEAVSSAIKSSLPAVFIDMVVKYFKKDDKDNKAEDK